MEFLRALGESKTPGYSLWKTNQACHGWHRILYLCAGYLVCFSVLIVRGVALISGGRYSSLQDASHALGMDTVYSPYAGGELFSPQPLLNLRA